MQASELGSELIAEATYQFSNFFASFYPLLEYMQGHELIFISLPIFLLMVVGLILIIRNEKGVSIPRSERVKFTGKLTDHIQAIAGEDAIGTQMDLARAYLEMGKRQLAREVLQNILQRGTRSQKQEARDLLNSL